MAVSEVKENATKYFLDGRWWMQPGMWILCMFESAPLSCVCVRVRVWLFFFFFFFFYFLLTAEKMCPFNESFCLPSCWEWGAAGLKSLFLWGLLFLFICMLMWKQKKKKKKEDEVYFAFVIFWPRFFFSAVNLSVLLILLLLSLTSPFGCPTCLGLCFLVQRVFFLFFFFFIWHL